MPHPVARELHVCIAFVFAPFETVFAGVSEELPVRHVQERTIDANAGCVILSGGDGIQGVMDSIGTKCLQSDIAHRADGLNSPQSCQGCSATEPHVHSLCLVASMMRGHDSDWVSDDWAQPFVILRRSRRIQCMVDFIGTECLQRDIS